MKTKQIQRCCCACSVQCSVRPILSLTSKFISVRLKSNELKIINPLPSDISVAGTGRGDLSACPELVEWRLSRFQRSCRRRHFPVAASQISAAYRPFSKTRLNHTTHIKKIFCFLIFARFNTVFKIIRKIGLLNIAEDGYILNPVFLCCIL